MRIIISESQFKRLILEQLGHSLEVEHEAQSIIDIIVKNVEQKEMSPNTDGIYSINGAFNKTLFGLDFNIAFNIYIAGHSPILQSACEIHDDGLSNLILELYIDESGNFISNLFQDTIYHELHHIYQYSKSTSHSLITNKELYQKAVNYLSYSTDSIEYKLALIIYFGNRVEQDAFIQGAFGSSKENIRKNRLSQRFGADLSIARDKLTELRKLYAELQYNIDDDEWVEKASLFHKPLTWFAKRLLQTIKRLTLKIKHINNYIINNL